LPSRNVGGKIYIVMESEAEEPSPAETQEQAPERVRELLEAKEETIAVLKETIRDLKETNRMITSTLRSEVELLKEAFGEMKTLYAAQIEHMRQEEPIPLVELAEAEEEAVPEIPEEASVEAREEWLELESFLDEQGVSRKKIRARFLEKVKRLRKKGATGVRKEGKRYLVSPPRAAKLLSKLLDKEKG
jgi:predicted nucleotide-binding protein (sugar kinase/HSP70/actin superfamily)